MNLASEAVKLRELAEQLERRGRAGDRDLARKARVRATEMELGDEHRMLSEEEIAMLLGSTYAGGL